MYPNNNQRALVGLHTHTHIHTVSYNVKFPDTKLTCLMTSLRPGQSPPQVIIAALTSSGLKYIFSLGPARWILMIPSHHYITNQQCKHTQIQTQTNSKTLPLLNPRTVRINALCSSRSWWGITNNLNSKQPKSQNLTNLRKKKQKSKSKSKNWTLRRTLSLLLMYPCQASSEG